MKRNSIVAMAESDERRRHEPSSEIPFQLVSDFEPRGDQPKAIDQLVQGLRDRHKFQTLVGVTGSGKTFTMANVIAQVNKPTLVVSHNKVLAAQLYSEFPELT